MSHRNQTLVAISILALSISGCSSFKKIMYGAGANSADTSYLTKEQRTWFDENRSDIYRDEAARFLYETDPDLREYQIEQVKEAIARRKKYSALQQRQTVLDEQNRIKAEREAKQNAIVENNLKNACISGQTKACRTLVVSFQQNDDLDSVIKYSETGCTFGEASLCETAKLALMKRNHQEAIEEQREANKRAREQKDIEDEQRVAEQILESSNQIGRSIAGTSTKSSNVSFCVIDNWGNKNCGYNNLDTCRRDAAYRRGKCVTDE